MLDISTIRAQTPSAASLVHFNNAGASLMPEIVSEGVIRYFMYEVAHGGYETAAFYKDELESFYTQTADLIKAQSNEIAFTESATVAWQRAFQSIDFKQGDVILTCSTEYASNYIVYLQTAKRIGIEIKVIPDNDDGTVNVHELANLITARVKLIAICHMPTANGLINPIEAIGEVASTHSILYLVDACQSVGQYPIDINKIKCDFLSATGRKYLRGPRGTGFLYARHESTHQLEPQCLDLHGAEWVSENSYEIRSDAKKYETWESSLSAKYGLALAIKYANSLGIAKIYSKINELASLMRAELSTLPGIKIQDTGTDKSGIITFTHSRLSTENIQKRLSQHGVNVSIAISSAAVLDLKARNISEVVRASVHYYNTEEEVNQMVSILKKINC